MSDLLYKQESYAIVGAAMSVHRELGHGFLEPVYQEALEIELNRAEIPYVREAELSILYRGQPLAKKYFADFVFYDKIILELKAVSSLTGDHEAQLFNYLKATQLQLGMLLNFGAPSIEYKRIACTTHFNHSSSANYAN
ncbi:MAG: GxxExxY protein [Lentisphaeria bacterium]|nr:GxxExxY protein [Lentisphaeria bacterium]